MGIPLSDPVSDRDAIEKLAGAIRQSTKSFDLSALVCEDNGGEMP